MVLLHPEGAPTPEDAEALKAAAGELPCHTESPLEAPLVHGMIHTVHNA